MGRRVCAPPLAGVPAARLGAGNTPTGGDTMSAFEQLLDKLRDHGGTVKETGDDKAVAQCPAHDDSRPSLSIGSRRDGKGATVFCHAGCDYAAVLDALGLAPRDLFDDLKMRAAYNGHTTYTYPDGRKVHRKPDKSFPRSGNTKGRSLFHADLIGDAETVYVPEGEKDVLAIEAAGGVAVCPAMGAGKARFADWTPMTGKQVIIVADNDAPGFKHARQVAELLRPIAASVRIVVAAVGKDAADHLAADRTLGEFVAHDDAEKTPETPESTAEDNPKSKPRGGHSRFIGPGGLRAHKLARAVTSSIACGFNDTTERFYTYDRGVWTPGVHPIEAMVGKLLGDAYRNSHTRNVLDMIRFSETTKRITDAPRPDYVNAPNGMIDWRTGRLLPHSPDYRSTVQLPVEYHPAATCPAFDRFLAEVLPKDCYTPTDDSPEGFIWELIGYAMYSGNPLHIAVMLSGIGRNGKGTLIRLLKTLLGERNCSEVGLHDLSENRFRAATLYGKLANLAGDLDARWIENTATFKSITGNDRIQAEHKYGTPFGFTPWALPVYSTNKPFGSADSSEGWIERWVVVPFPREFTGDDKDIGLDAKLQTDAELRGIMARGIRALPAVITRGRLPQPTTVADAKEAFIAASDAVRAWIRESCELDFDAWTPRTDLYREYRLHTCADGSKTMGAREFYNRIGQIRGITPATRNGNRGFKGVRLLVRSQAFI
jgi:putative DNA primase/helicase